MEELFIVAGLGNPGKRYEKTRHNAGFEAIDYLSESLHIPVERSKFKGLVGEGRMEETKVVLIKPQTYMNLSGECLMEVMQFYKADMRQLIVVYDDIDFEVGKIKVKAKGSSGSHNGMKSIIFLLNSDAFPRVRIGIGKPPPYYDLSDYVLSKFDADEAKQMEVSVKKAADAVVEIMKNGIEKTMSLYNKS